MAMINGPGLSVISFLYFVAGKLHQLKWIRSKFVKEIEVYNIQV